MIRVREAVFYDGTGEVICDERNTPHTWDVLLRCSQAELDAFRALQAGQSVQVQVGDVGVGHAQVAVSEEPGHVRLTGLGFCPYPDH